MHELSVAEALREVVCQEARKAGAERITGLVLHIGRYRAIVPEVLRQCMEFTLAETPAAGARIEIVEIPIRVRCPTCKQIRELSEPFLLCPVCGDLCAEVLSGRELLLHSMEIED
jgi:hydrogenase nickel incorporation protein HypA/HybF